MRGEPGADTNLGAPRRTVIAGLGSVITGLAGCGSNQLDEGSANDSTGSEERTAGAGQGTSSPSETLDGGTLIIGLAKSPESLNPLAGSHQLLTRMLFTVGTEFHPHRSEPVPWAFEDWTLDVENIGTSSPTLIGQLREDLAFSDGTPITAEDAKFTIDFIREQQVTGAYPASQLNSIESVEVDSDDGQAVNYFFSKPYGAWFSQVLGQILLPKHIWKDVADYQQYAPSTTPDGVVGSGAFEVESVNFGNWFEFRLRPRPDIWQTNATYVDWFHPEAPFVDSIRVQIFGSRQSLHQAVIGGNVDAGFAPVSVDRAIKAKQDDSLEVRSSQTAGWHHHSYNTRRVPLDDPAFRQLLVKLVDKEWIVEELDQGIGSVKGSYAAPKFTSDWRPPEPHERESYMGIPTPTLGFPGQPGSFELSPVDIDVARSFLTQHPNASHEYSWQSVRSPSGSQEVVLHIDGVPFEKAHSNNAGEPGQGPLVVSFNPPEEDLDESRIAQEWISALRAVGIPTAARIQSFGSQVTEVFVEEDFDVIAMNWTNLPPDFTYFEQLFGRWGADLEGDANIPHQNAMGYTGADDLIEAQRTTMSAEDRKPLVKQLAARIWNDAPTNILKHDIRHQPVNQGWEGWIETAALGVLNLHTFLNVRQSPASD